MQPLENRASHSNYFCISHNLRGIPQYHGIIIPFFIIGTYEGHILFAKPRTNPDSDKDSSRHLSFLFPPPKLGTCRSSSLTQATAYLLIFLTSISLRFGLFPIFFLCYMRDYRIISHFLLKDLVLNYQLYQLPKGLLHPGKYQL